MNEIITIDTIHQYNDCFGLETLNPLVSIVDLSTIKPPKQAVYKINYGLYCLFLKDLKCGDIRYGRNYYDYQEGTIVCYGPGQVVTIENGDKVTGYKGWGLVFHPDLIRGTSLGTNIANYHFFSYESVEALHLSERERQTVFDCFHKIQTELHHDIDSHTQRLVVRNIELLLDYCDRFYDRQFITRRNVNNDLLTRLESLLNGYFQSDKPVLYGLPSVKFCADALNLSPNYFGDLVRKQTGRSAIEYVQAAVVSAAKNKLLSSNSSISEIAYNLGFKYPQHFTRMFKKQTGQTPADYRSQNN